MLYALRHADPSTLSDPAACWVTLSYTATGLTVTFVRADWALTWPTHQDAATVQDMTRYAGLCIIPGHLEAGRFVPADADPTDTPTAPRTDPRTDADPRPAECERCGRYICSTATAYANTPMRAYGPGHGEQHLYCAPCWHQERADEAPPRATTDLDPRPIIGRMEWPPLIDPASIGPCARCGQPLDTAYTLHAGAFICDRCATAGEAPQPRLTLHDPHAGQCQTPEEAQALIGRILTQRYAEDLSLYGPAATLHAIADALTLLAESIRSQDGTGQPPADSRDYWAQITTSASFVRGIAQAQQLAQPTPTV